MGFDEVFAKSVCVCVCDVIKWVYYNFRSESYNNCQGRPSAKSRAKFGYSAGIF